MYSRPTMLLKPALTCWHPAVLASGPSASASTSRYVQKRDYSALSHIVQVVTNPSSAINSLNESWRSWDEWMRWRNEARERKQLDPFHAFTRFPKFFRRENELKALESSLEDDPCFTVVFGGSSVGKTALLRQILCTPNKYHVLHFDLRVSGFADIESLYWSLSQQMEQYFVSISKEKGFEDFAKEGWRFKHDRLDVQRRIANANASERVIRSDLARLMECFQSALLRYRRYKPEDAARTSSMRSHGSWSISKRKEALQRRTQAFKRMFRWEVENTETPEPLTKRKLVFFLDEAHKLPKLLQSSVAMKLLLDFMLVLTKQDRLCHVVHSTSDPFYQTWLRERNVMQHCKLITIGDCSKSETRRFFQERKQRLVDPAFHGSLDFEKLYDAFGGRLVHWEDFLTDYDNTRGRLTVEESSHFIQAHALLNLSIIHSSRASGLKKGLKRRSMNPARPLNDSAGLAGQRRNSHDEPLIEPNYASHFTAEQLLSVMRQLTQPGVRGLSYFALCRTYGPRAVDDMVCFRILDLRWMKPVTDEEADDVAEFARHTNRPAFGEMAFRHAGGGTGSAADPGSPKNFQPVELSTRNGVEKEEVFGPKVIPASPIMRHAMRKVVKEYADGTLTKV